MIIAAIITILLVATLAGLTERALARTAALIMAAAHFTRALRGLLLDGLFLAWNGARLEWRTYTREALQAVE